MIVRFCPNDHGDDAELKQDKGSDNDTSCLSDRLFARHCMFLSIKVMLHWSTCNANLQRRFATHVFRTNLQIWYTFESLSKTSNALQHCKYRKESSATGCYTGKIFRATSYHCKLALQVDQCNTTFKTRDDTEIDEMWQTEWLELRTRVPEDMSPSPTLTIITELVPRQFTRVSNPRLCKVHNFKVNTLPLESNKQCQLPGFFPLHL